MGAEVGRGHLYACPVSEYVIRFTAENPGGLDAAATERLAGAARAIPGTRPMGKVLVDRDRHRIEAEFAIDVEQAMAEAARDGGRLAKEMLLAARMPEARLVEMSVRMEGVGNTD